MSPTIAGGALKPRLPGANVQLTRPSICETDITSPTISVPRMMFPSTTPAAAYSPLVDDSRHRSTPVLASIATKAKFLAEVAGANIVLFAYVKDLTISNVESQVHLIDPSAG